jgi:hypothetical protein
MAKKALRKAPKRARTARNARKKASTRRVKTPAPRVTTRRAPAGGARSRGGPPAATTRSRAAARAETLQVTLELRDVSDRLIRDPETFFTFRRVSDRRQIGDQLALELTGSAAAFNLPVGTGEIAVCEIDPKRYRFAHSPVFFLTPGPPITKSTQLFREPKEWTPGFTRWSSLSPAFADLKRVLEQSPDVTLFRDDRVIAPRLVEGAYDGMSGDDVALAKTALLNTHYRLSTTREPVAGERTWFSFLSRMVAIGRERFLAFVVPEMETLVRQIHAGIDEFRGDYERTPAENHRGNVPSEMQGRITSMISIKSSHSKGNFQLTLTHLSGPDEVLLDVDIDENGELLAHTADLFKHKITGGTHPHDIHELLVHEARMRELTGFDLGYRLV